MNTVEKFELYKKGIVELRIKMCELNQELTMLQKEERTIQKEIAKIRMEEIQKRRTRMEDSKGNYYLREHNNGILVSNISDRNIYIVEYEEDVIISCTCKDYKMRGSKLGIPCKHMYYVMDRLSFVMDKNLDKNLDCL